MPGLPTDILAALGLLSSPPAAPGVDDQPWLRRFKGQDLQDAGQLDGSPIPSWVDRAGSGDPAVQTVGGSQPVLRTGQGGIGSKAVVSLDGANDFLRTSAGASALSGPFYVGVVGRFRSLGSSWQSLVGWGEESPGARRLLLCRLDTGTVAFSAYQSDTTPYLTPETVGEATFWECWYDGAVVWVARNGVVQCVGVPHPNPLAAYTAPAITLGVNTAGNDAAAVDLAEVLIRASIPGILERAAILDYVAQEYGLPSMLTRLPLVSVDGNAGSASGFLDDGRALFALRPVCVGGSQPLLAGAPPDGTAVVPASLSVLGPIVCRSDGSAGEHTFVGGSRYANVGSIYNQDVAGFGTWCFRDYNRKERGAFGFANPLSGWPWGGPRGSLFLELSNFADPGWPGDYREVQTQPGNLRLCRRWRDDTRAEEIYDDTASEPALNGPTPGLVSLLARPATVVPDGGVLSTTITMPNVGIVVVKDKTNSRGAFYTLSDATLTALAGSHPQFSTEQDNPGTVNTYASGGQLVIQNNSGGTLALTAGFRGA